MFHNHSFYVESYSLTLFTKKNKEIKDNYSGLFPVLKAVLLQFVMVITVIILCICTTQLLMYIRTKFWQRCNVNLH